MKTFRIFYLLILSSLFGCNTLVTKPAEPVENANEIAYSLPAPQRIDVTPNLPLLVEQSGPSTLYWKTKLVATQAKVKDSSKITNSSKSGRTSKNSSKRLKRLKRVKKSYPIARNYTAKQKLIKNTPTISQAIAKVIKLIPEKRGFKAQYSAKTGNLWDRVRSGYAFSTVDNNQVQHEMEKFLAHPSYFQRISSKASPYFYHIVKEVEKRGMPMELALLPAIESAFEPRAISHKSAAGLWQFIPATGRYYGLEQDKWYDGRRDIVASTNAALNYLKTLSEMFDGDWFLALAAYNYGEGNIGKAIRRNEKANRPTDFWSLKLPRETREYVPKLIALTKIVANPKKYGIKLQLINNKPYFTKVKIDHQIDLSIVAKLAGISDSDLKLLNSCYKRGVTSPEGPYDISLPVSKVSQFKQRLAQIPSALELVKTASLTNESIVEPKRVNIEIDNKPTSNLEKYKVEKGDTLLVIAKRYNLSIDKIRSLNQLGKNDSLRIGQQLMVAASAQVNKTHKVRQGDNWWKIAKQYGTTVSLLKKLNNFKDNYLKVGKLLLIPN